MPVLMPIEQAIGREEGFYLTGSRAQRNNNPGNIEFGAFAQQHGATHGDPRFAVFPSAQEGFAAVRALLSNYVRGNENITLSEAINKWAPPVENKTDLYLNNICTWVGWTAEVKLADVLRHS